MYDSHNHLQDPRLLPHFNKVLSNCKVIGVKRMVVNGTSEADWSIVAELAKDHPVLLPSFGLHPWKIKSRSSNWQALLIQYLHNQPSAIGEIGLDRWVDGFDIDDQLEVFDIQWQLAHELNRPVTIHCLKAWGLLLEKLEASPQSLSGFLLHSYSGSADLIKPLVQLGAYFSISGYFAQDKKKKHWDVLKQIPLDRLLLETDAPDMLPPKNLNLYPINEYKINHPANIKSVYHFSAELFEISEYKLKTQVASNFNKLFNFTLRKL